MAIIVSDLDDVAVDNSERALRASAAGKMDWAALFDPAQIPLDQPIPHALAALQTLAADGHTIWYVSSRQDTCAEATMIWLAEQNYPHPTNVICRPQFTKTVEFKAATVARLHAEQGPVILFVDDKAANRDAIAALGIAGLDVRGSF